MSSSHFENGLDITSMTHLMPNRFELEKLDKDYYYYLTHDGLPTVTKGVRRFERRIGDAP